MLSLQQAAAMTEALRIVGAPQQRFERVHTDSRSVQPGDLFVALRGERFDAHDFLAQAHGRGAAAALVEAGRSAPPGLALIEVADTRQALGRLAAGWRARFDLPLVAVTGSNGKTTVTQMLASILAAWHGEDGRLATQGNLNNDIGVPLTLLRLRAAHRSAVVELGMNHPGEIVHLAAWANPTVALVNNAQREHQEFMHGVEAVARENGSVFTQLRAGGVAVHPCDRAEHEAIWAQQAGAARRLRFALVDAEGGAAEQADVVGRALSQPQAPQRLAVGSPWGAFEIELALAGCHNQHNALAAASCALAAGAPVASVVEGLARFRPVKGRLVPHRLVIGGQTVQLIDDSYNANPDSVRAAIDTLAAAAQPAWLVLGDMGEVGAQGEAFHREVGAYARARGIARLFALGAYAPAVSAGFGTEGAAAVEHERIELARQLACAMVRTPPATVLIKGSRFMRMEEFVAGLLRLDDQQRAAAERAACAEGGHAA
jgi:UDP-N-acetylmuramoyl-tripeptide--D-alanyl-D-alanine ligase